MNYLRETKNLRWTCAGLGLIGLFLRIRLLSVGMDDKGLLVRGHITDWLCLLLGLLALGAVFLALRGKPDTQRSHGLFPSCPIAAVSGLIAAAGLGLAAWSDWQAASSNLDKLTAALGFLSALAVIFLTLCRYRELRPHFLVRCVVTAFFVLHLLHEYRVWFPEPQVTVYLPRLLAQVMLMLNSYHRTALEAGIGGRKAHIFTSQLALFFCLLALPGDGDQIFYLTMSIWMLLDSGTLELPEETSGEPVLLTEEAAPVPEEAP